VDNLHHARAVEGGAQREHLIQGRPQGIDVRALVDLVQAAFRLFRRHVVRRAQGHPGSGHLRFGLDILGQAEVREHGFLLRSQ